MLGALLYLPLKLVDLLPQLLIFRHLAIKKPNRYPILFLQPLRGKNVGITALVVAVLEVADLDPALAIRAWRQ